MNEETTSPASHHKARFRNIKAILFDLDGTLIAADKGAPLRLVKRLHFLRGLLSEAELDRLVLRVLAVSEIPSNYGLAWSERMGVNSDWLGIMDRLRRLKGVGTRSNSDLIPGTVEMLIALQARYRLAVVTGRSRPAAAFFLQAHGLEGYFETVTTRHDTWFLKPHPAPIRHTARLLGLRTAQCLMVGDSPLDIRAAKAAGALAVGVLTGFGERTDLERAGSDLILPRAADLVQVLIPETTDERE